MCYLVPGYRFYLLLQMIMLCQILLVVSYFKLACNVLALVEISDFRSYKTVYQHEVDTKHKASFKHLTHFLPNVFYA